jgi:hypothetical protein
VDWNNAMSLQASRACLCPEFMADCGGKFFVCAVCLGFGQVSPCKRLLSMMGVVRTNVKF